MNLFIFFVYINDYEQLKLYSFYRLYVVFEFIAPGKGVLTFMNEADGEKYFALASSTRFSAA
jgi:hypothetical protein